MLKTDNRFVIETLISIAKATSDATKREALLEEALLVLRAGETNRDICGIDKFLNGYEPTPKQKMRQTELYNQYVSFAMSEGFRVIGKQYFYQSLLDRGYRQSTLHGYPVFYVRKKERETC